jgi:hypothetical protein
VAIPSNLYRYLHSCQQLIDRSLIVGPHLPISKGFLPETPYVKGFVRAIILSTLQMPLAFRIVSRLPLDLSHQEMSPGPNHLHDQLIYRFFNFRLLLLSHGAKTVIGGIHPSTLRIRDNLSLGLLVIDCFQDARKSHP